MLIIWKLLTKRAEMLLVKTKLNISPIHGIGLFAVEFIPAKTIVWKFHPAIDLI